MPGVREEGMPLQSHFLQKTAATFSLITAAVSFLGLLGIILGNTDLTSITPGFKPISFSTACIFMFLGIILAINSLRPFHGSPAKAVMAILSCVVIVESLELPLNLRGGHFIFEDWAIAAGSLFCGTLSTPISPVAIILIILSAISVILIIHCNGSEKATKGVRDSVGILGAVISIISLIFILSYLYSTPLTAYIPISIIATVSAFFLGMGIVAATGRSAIPLKYFMGNSARARLLRVFFPLMLIVIIAESIVYPAVLFFSGTTDIFLLSGTVVVFLLITGLVVARIVEKTGGALETAQRKLVNSNEQLTAFNEELIAAQEDLSRNNEQLRSSLEIVERLTAQRQLALDAARMGWWQYNLTTRIISYDERYRQIFKLDGDQIPSDILVKNRIYPDDLPHLTAKIESVLDPANPKQYFVEYRINLPEGKTRWIASYGIVTFENEGPLRRPSGIIGTVEDITERKHAEENIRQYRIFIENAFDSILIIRLRDGRIIDANKLALKTYGYTREEMLAMTAFDVRAAEEAEIVKENMAKASLEGLRMESIHRRKDGTTFPVEISAVGFVLDNEQLLISIIRDITERKQAENALSLANRKLNILNSITRHDIRNQLTAMRGYLELYHEDCKDDHKMERYFFRMRDISTIIERQLDFAKFYQELGSTAPVWQNVQKTARTVAQNGPFGEFKVITDTGNLEIYADKLLEKVFYNLFDNSMRHGNHVTEIHVSFIDSNGKGILVVEDNGAGIPVSEKENIFDRGKGKNTGLGLFLIREILSITGLTIRENGEPGRGARFEIVVPQGVYRFKDAL